MGKSRIFRPGKLSSGHGNSDASGVSSAVTNGIRIEVESEYLKAQSDPRKDRFVFMYTVKIHNQGEQTVQLRTRHWVITDANQVVREVRGEWVVGQQPVLGPGDSHQYQSGCILETAWGTMHGSYQFDQDNLSSFDAEIAPFLLAAPTITSAQELN